MYNTISIFDFPWLAQADAAPELDPDAFNGIDQFRARVSAEEQEASDPTKIKASQEHEASNLLGKQVLGGWP